MVPHVPNTLPMARAWEGPDHSRAIVAGCVELLEVMAWKESLWGPVPFVAMVTVEFTDVGILTIGKAAMSQGMSPFFYVLYSNALATLLLFPSFIFLRVCFGQSLGYVGVRYSSRTLSSSMMNLVPDFAFLLAIIFRMEKLHMRSSISQAKVAGALVSISGAFVVTLNKGPPIIIIPSSSKSPHDQFLLLSSQSNWVLGGSILAFVSFLTAVWNIVQTATMKEYPSEMTIILFYCLFGTIQSSIFSLVAEKDPGAWRLKTSTEFIAVIYSAIFGSLGRGIIHTLALHKKGPVYVAMFRPLSIVIAVFMSVSFLGDMLHLGSVIGAIIISFGFYAVLWGKAKEENLDENPAVLSSESSTHNASLLQNKCVDQ